MRQGHTTAIPVADEADIEDAEVSFTVNVTIKVKDLHHLHKGLDDAAVRLDFVDALYPVVVIGAQAYEAAKAQLGAQHVNGHTNPVNADLIVPVILAIEEARARGELDLIEALAIAGDPQDLADALGIEVPSGLAA